MGPTAFLLPLREKVAAKPTDEGSRSACSYSVAIRAERPLNPSSGPSGHLLPQGEKGMK
jgi:hypothetical protein